MTGLSPTRRRGLGVRWVWGRRRVPLPATGITTFTRASSALRGDDRVSGNDLSAVLTVFYGNFNGVRDVFGRAPPLRSGSGCARRRQRYNRCQRRRAPCASGQRYCCCPAAPGSRPCGRASLTQRRPSAGPARDPHPPALSPVRDLSAPSIAIPVRERGRTRHSCPSHRTGTRPARAESIPRPGAPHRPPLPRPPSTRRHSAPGTRHPAPGTRHPAPGTRHPALGTRHSALTHSRTHALTHSRTHALPFRQHTRPPNHPSNRPRLPSGAPAP